MARSNRVPVRMDLLTPADRRWIERMHREAQMAEHFWQEDAETFQKEYGGQWVALQGGQVRFHTPNHDVFHEWLKAHDPARNRFLIRHVAEPDAEFAFRTGS